MALKIKIKYLMFYYVTKKKSNTISRILYNIFKLIYI